MRFLIEIKFVMQIWVYISQFWKKVQNVRCKLRIERTRHNFFIFLSCGGNRLVQTDICTVSLKIMSLWTLWSCKNIFPGSVTVCQSEDLHIIFFIKLCTEAAWYHDIAVQMKSGPLWLNCCFYNILLVFYSMSWVWHCDEVWCIVGDFTFLYEQWWQWDL